jgi:HPr Serine kinase C-terminal domain
MKLQISTGDPLLYDFDLPLCVNFYFLGFPIQITTNSPEVLAAAQESWGMFDHTRPEPPLKIQIGVLPDSSTERPNAPVVRGRGHQLTQIADSENFMVLDSREGFAFGWLTRGAVQDRAYLRYHFLEGTVWILLETLYLTSVHGACVELNGHGVLLCGDSGAGKTSLAYACAHNGWKFLSDDSTCLIRNRPGRIVTGNSRQMRFRESAVQLFPELIHQRVSARPTGEMSIEVPTAETPEINFISEASVDYIVFLNRFESLPDGMVRFSKRRALQWFHQIVCYGEANVREAHYATLQNLLSAEIFEMRYTRIESALDMLKKLVYKGAGAIANNVAVTEERQNA